MKNIKKIFLMGMVLSSPLFSAPMIEDAEDGTTNGWIALAGSTVSNVTDADTDSKVIKLSSSIYTYYRMDNLDSASKKIQWDIKTDKSFIVYVSVMTTEGARLFYYTTLNRDYGVTSSGIHHGLGEAVADGTWHTVERDLEAELQVSEPDNTILKVTSFKIRAIDDVFLDNIMGDEPTPTPIPTATPTPLPTVTPPTCDASVAIEDAEDGTTSGWIALTGSTVSNVLEAGNQVIKLSSSAYKYYRMDNLDNASKTITWDIKTDKSFIVYVSVMTTEGARLFYYTTLNRDYGVTSSGIHHGIGEAVKDGTWHTVARDLEAELHESEPDNTILKITSFKIRATDDVFLDNIMGCDGYASVENHAPVANAGDNQTVAMENEGVEIQLDGSSSSDSDGDIITYTWSFVSQPSGATGTLSDTDIVNPTFNADVVGDYTLQLVVNDGQVDSVTDTVTITVEETGFEGLKGTYYGTNIQLTDVSQFRNMIANDEATTTATFVATNLDYGSGAGGVGQAENLQTFFLKDDASSLSNDPSDTTDGGINLLGKIYLDAGTYNFRVQADDGYQIKIDGVSVGEIDQNQALTTTVQSPFVITESGYHDIDIIWWDQGGEYAFKVELSEDNGASYSIINSDILKFL